MTEATGEKKPAQGGLSTGDTVLMAAPWGAPTGEVEINSTAAAELEALAQEFAALARRAFLNAEHEPEGSFGRRFIEHGAFCYFNCWGRLRQFLDAASPQPSATQEEG